MTRQVFRAAYFALLFAGASALTACDSGPSALPARDHSAAAVDAATRLADASQAKGATSSYARSDQDSRQAATEETPLFHGKPIWSSSKKYSATENVDYHFKRDGAAFGAATADDYVAKAHAFIEHPPRGALTMTRKNGDTLIYDPKANTFAVATKDGAPRTMFKPDDGMAYWQKQKDREAKVAKSGHADDANG